MAVLGFVLATRDMNPEVATIGGFHDGLVKGGQGFVGQSLIHQRKNGNDVILKLKIRICQFYFILHILWKRKIGLI